MALRAKDGRAPLDGASPHMRLDVLLFELRLFRSRTQAAAACHSGHVLVNGVPAKPSREARAGDRLRLTVGPPRTLELLELPRVSLSKADARRCYRELAEER
jgi:ribosome-associated heat shock protein Hsp15